jgi:ATP-dependent 26S proteasome regulatory subunit
MQDFGPILPSQALKSPRRSNIVRVSAYIPDDFRDVILLHIAKNYMSNVRPALILAIQGPPGEGKSFQVREVCAELAVSLISLSGSELAGPYEGEANSPLQKSYLQASALSKQHHIMTTLLIDDFDLSVASRFENTQNTVNTQLLSGFLMNLADDPHSCAGQETSRVPIILTGNDFGALHGPLRRHGRMDFFNWRPNREQKEAIVASIFRDIVKSGEFEDLRQLVSRYRTQPVSFFAAVKEDLLNGAILNIVKRDRRINIEDLEAAIVRDAGADLEKLLALAAKRLKGADQ